MKIRGKDSREIRFRAAADEIIRSNRKIRDHIQAVKSFYLGDVTVPIPTLDNRLETILNPKCNGACKCLDDLCEAMMEYRPGEYPEKELNILHKTTLHVIHNEIEPIQRTQVCNMLVTLIKDIHGYLTTPCKNFSLEKHILQLNKYRTQWSVCCCKNSDAFYERTSKLIAARNAPSAAKLPRRKRGKQADWRKEDPAIIKRREDTKRVLAEIKKRHKAMGRSYTKIIDEMKQSSVWGARMKHMSIKTWKSRVCGN